MKNSLATVNVFLQLTSSQEDHVTLLPKIGELLSDDFRFVGPAMETNGKNEYLALLNQFLSSHVSFKIFQQFEANNNVCSINEISVNTPKGEVRMKMAEWFKLKDNKIVEQEIFYDPREFLKAMELE